MPTPLPTGPTIDRRVAYHPDERLAVLESQFYAVQQDVTEIKADVKNLVLVQQQLATALAVKEASECSEREARSSTGVWVRSFLPWIVAILALLLSVANTYIRLAP